MASNPKIIVIGGGLAGLSAVIKIAEMGGQVDLFSIVPVKRSHSVCAQGGINAAKNLKGEGDSTWQHFDDTIYGGDFLANQPPVKAMCEAAPAIIDLLDRMGVPFNRTPEGLLDFRRFGGTLFNRTAFAGATTTSSSAALPARSPMPLIVHSICRTPARIAASEFATAIPKSSWQCALNVIPCVSPRDSRTIRNISAYSSGTA